MLEDKDINTGDITEDEPTREELCTQTQIQHKFNIGAIA